MMKICFLSLLIINMTLCGEIITNNVEFQNNVITNNFQINYPVLANTNGLNTYQMTTMNVNNLFFDLDILMIGNNDKQTELYITSLPVLDAIPDPLRTLMITLYSSNYIYIGNENSPIPSPDFYVIPNLKVNNLYALNNLYLGVNTVDGKIILGQSEVGNIVITGNILSISNSSDMINANNMVLKSAPYSLHFICPIMTNDIVNINNKINVIGNLIYSGTEPILINTISYQNLNSEGLLALGRREEDSKVVFGGTFEANNSLVSFGSINSLIKKMVNIPMVDTVTDQHNYVLFNPTTQQIFKGPSKVQSSVEKDVIYDDLLHVDFINQDNTAETFFVAKEIIINGDKTNMNGNFFFNNVLINGNVFFNSITNDTDISLPITTNINCKILGAGIDVAYASCDILSLYNNVTIPFSSGNNINLDGFYNVFIKNDNGLVCIQEYPAQKNAIVNNTVEKMIQECLQVVALMPNDINEVNFLETTVLDFIKKVKRNIMKFKYQLRGSTV